MKTSLELKYAEIRRFEEKQFGIDELYLKLMNIDTHFAMLAEQAAKKAKEGKKESIMKTILLVLFMVVLSYKPCLADVDDKAMALGYAKADDIQVVICDDFNTFNQIQRPCNALIARMKSGHLVNEGDYNARCGDAKALRDKVVKYAADYKKVYGKNFDYKACR